MANLAFELRVSTRTILRDINDLTPYYPIWTSTKRNEAGVYYGGRSKEKSEISDGEVATLEKILKTGIVTEETRKEFETIIQKIKKKLHKTGQV